jgi:hypothetical protein
VQQEVLVVRWEEAHRRSGNPAQGPGPCRLTRFRRVAIGASRETFPSTTSIWHGQLCEAIQQRRLVRFVYDGRLRVAEPHEYGLTDGGKLTLFFWQVAGETSPGRPLGWRKARVSGVTKLELLDRRFPGPRPTPSGQHIDWEVLFASVSARERAASE